MASSCQEEDFQLVSKRKSRKHPAKPILHDEDCLIDKKAATRRIESAKEDILSSDFYSSLTATLREAFSLIGNPIVKEIVCLGLGHIGSSMVSRYQFALLLCLKNNYKAKTLVYDPIFHKTELEILDNFNCEFIGTNEEGKHKVKPRVTTILYFPHCSRELTNNFLWKNWSIGLKDCIIIGNSFTQIIENEPRKMSLEKTKYILNISPHVDEFSVINTFKYSDIFNDTSVHVFQENKLKWLPPEFWSNCEEPQYNNDELELITKLFTTNL